MKLLRDFFRFRTAGRFSLAGRRQAVRPVITVTVPQPLTPRQAVERAQADVARTSRHLHLVSSH
ncbi:hypothetical protein [Dyella nitratireducens]|uniref:Uncharacterized protein n=1 Tax=Dyella nitratireducens TaxID=1849580 RepID=A0ABQ1GQT0_9GAMM|nr:hypothetical protein [Dyella nitratireducens]GGA48572.1 hypothetical protein GCM10010981_42290 [Dyella nitratireducens]